MEDGEEAALPAPNPAAAAAAYDDAVSKAAAAVAAAVSERNAAEAALKQAKAEVAQARAAAARAARGAVPQLSFSAAAGISANEGGSELAASFLSALRSASTLGLSESSLTPEQRALVEQRTQAAQRGEYQMGPAELAAMPHFMAAARQFVVGDIVAALQSAAATMSAARVGGKRVAEADVEGQRAARLARYGKAPPPPSTGMTEGGVEETKGPGPAAGHCTQD